MASKYKIAIVVASVLLFAQTNVTFARNAFNNFGRDTGRAIGNIAHGTGRVVSDSGHIVVHGTGRIVKTTTHGMGHAAKGY